jgi:hypothetical protein
VRVRLHKQYKLEGLKKKLDEMDERHHSIDPDTLKTIGEDIHEGSGERDKLIGEIDMALKEFGEFKKVWLHTLKFLLSLWNILFLSRAAF